MLTPGIGPATVELSGLLLFSKLHAVTPTAAVSTLILKRVLHIPLTQMRTHRHCGARVRNAVYRLEVCRSVASGIRWDESGRQQVF